MRVTADTRKCLGTGNCALSAPEVFDQDDDDGTVVLLNSQPPDKLRSAVRRAVELCPSGALKLAEDTEPAETKS